LETRSEKNKKRIVDLYLHLFTFFSTPLTYVNLSLINDISSYPSTMELLRNAHEAACERLEVAAMNFAELPADAPAQVRGPITRTLDEANANVERLQKAIANLAAHHPAGVEGDEAEPAEAANPAGAPRQTRVPKELTEGWKLQSPAFETHLAKFKRVLRENGLDLEQSWKRLLTTVLPLQECEWFEEAAEGWLDWDAAELALRARLVSARDHLERVNEALQLSMNGRETLDDFVQRFLQALREARLLNEGVGGGELAERFVLALPREAQYAIHQARLRPGANQLIAPLGNLRDAIDLAREAVRFSSVEEDSYTD
jgi:hypothetical protein